MRGGGGGDWAQLELTNALMVNSKVLDSTSVRNHARDKVREVYFIGHSKYNEFKLKLNSFKFDVNKIN